MEIDPGSRISTSRSKRVRTRISLMRKVRKLTTASSWIRMIRRKRASTAACHSGMATPIRRETDDYPRRRRRRGKRAKSTGRKKGPRG